MSVLLAVLTPLALNYEALVSASNERASLVAFVVALPALGAALASRGMARTEFSRPPLVSRFSLSFASGVSLLAVISVLSAPRSGETDDRELSGMLDAVGDQAVVVVLLCSTVVLWMFVAWRRIAIQARWVLAQRRRMTKLARRPI